MLREKKENDTHLYSRPRTFPVNRQKVLSHGNVRASRYLAVALEFLVETANCIKSSVDAYRCYARIFNFLSTFSRLFSSFLVFSRLYSRRSRRNFFKTKENSLERS